LEFQKGALLGGKLLSLYVSDKWLLKGPGCREPASSRREYGHLMMAIILPQQSPFFLISEE
jgi:hypothetical protein